jgi:hypothetical protein
MTFFYDLNKKLDEIRATPSNTHGQLNERDMSRAAKGYEKYGKEGMEALAKAGREGKSLDPIRDKYNKYDESVEEASGDYSAKKAAAGKDIGKPGKNFSKIAADAGKRYGSKAAGERVAGAVLNKLRHPKEGMEEGQLNELSPELLKRARDAAGMKYAHADDRKDQKASDKYNRQDDKFNSALRKKQKQKDMDEGDTGPLTKATGGRANMPTSDVRSKYYPPAKPPVKKFAQPTTAFDRSKTGGLSQSYAQDQASRPAGMNPDPASRYDMGEAELDEVSRGEYIKQQDTNAEKSGKQKFNAFGQTFDTDEIDEGGLPMTTVNGKKVPKFAADGRGANDLAKKKSFNDKIAGAKQEVEEMLGDVAAEAMRNALGKKQMADEGFDDMERDVKRRLSTPKVGDVRRGARHDIETTATGVRATRRQDDETDDQPTGEKRRAGRPKGADKGPERVTGKAYKHKGSRKTNEGDIDITDRGEYDQEGDMAKDSIKTVVRHAQALEKILGDNDNLPEWVQSKLAKIESMMTAVDDYMQNQEDDQGDDMPMGEESTNKRDNRAERAGKRVTKDIESDEKKKEKKVAETTTSGSVATGGDAPKASKGGMQVGKGIYDSLNRKVEGMIAESMSINVSMTKDDNGSHKNITVTASDEDAESLAQLLRSAGLGGDMSNGHAEPCPACGSTDCGCDQGMAEAYGDTDASQNEPNWPTDTEYSDDAMQYSGGLNGPKSTGQTTVPVIAHQGERTGVDDEELRRMMEMAGIQQNLKPWERTMKEAAVEEAMPATDAQIDPQATRQYAEKIIKSLDQYTGQGMFDSKYNDDGSITIFKKRDRQWTDEVYRQMGRNPNDSDLKQPGVLTGENMNKAVGPYFDMFRSKGWRFDQPVAGQFTIGVTKAQQPAVAEGVVDKVKDAVKKGLEKLGHGSDEDMRKDLQKKMGVPPTGKKPEDKKMEESLMQEFANFKI